MERSATPMPAPAWLRELTDARATYEELLGWPVSVQVGQRVLVVAVGDGLDAVAMPAALGAMVRAQLGIYILSAPIVARADLGRWTFLSKSTGTIRPSVCAALSEARVQLAPPGSYVVIPTSMGSSASGAVRWIEGPRPHRALPPTSAIVGLARRLTYGGTLGRTA